MGTRSGNSKSGRREPGTASRFASKTGFDALAVDQLPSDTEADPAAESTPSTPMTRSATKRAAKTKTAKDAKGKAGKREVKKEDADDAGAGDTEAHVVRAGETATPATDGGSTAAEVDGGDVCLRRQDASRDAVAAALPATPVAATGTVAPAAQRALRTEKPRDEKAVGGYGNRPVAKVAPPPADTSETRRAFWKKVRERTIFSLLMIGGFIGILAMGPSYLILLVLVLEILVYREVTALFSMPGRARLLAASRAASETEDEDGGAARQAMTQREELWGKALSWYFFAVCNFFLYGESLIYYINHIVSAESSFPWFAQHLRFISFMLYMAGFMAFVLNLKRENLKNQFGLFCWVHMSLFFIVFLSHFIVNNIMEGLIWFWVPASLVICNDCFAYMCGMAFGRTPLFTLSPKKTVEGFVGALLITTVFAWFWAGFFQQFDYMTCPAVNLGMNAFSGVTCDANPVFREMHTALPDGVAHVLSAVARRPVTTFTWTPFQCHALAMAAFASLIAPFGGFFASGFKRAFKIKDFGDSIPGHGGLTDRFDCQFLMGLFSFVYYASIVRESRATVRTVFQLIVAQLPRNEQMQLLRELTQYLGSRG
ncbi:phosphatidate cytidylyltransferase [Malassezia sp. CBS 17886]|nr:phosphatidate cytidylyltransferase [Malassezia sp. CBS 17886]